MNPTDIYRDAYPEQLLAAMRDEIRRAEREQAARDAAARRRRERWAALRVRIAGWTRSSMTRSASPPAATTTDSNDEFTPADARAPWS